MLLRQGPFLVNPNSNNTPSLIINCSFITFITSTLRSPSDEPLFWAAYKEAPWTAIELNLIWLLLKFQCVSISITTQVNTITRSTHPASAHIKPDTVSTQEETQVLPWDGKG